MMKFFVTSRRRHTRCGRDWSSDVCSSDLFTQSPAGIPSVIRIPPGDCVNEFGRAPTGLTCKPEAAVARPVGPTGGAVPRPEARPRAAPAQRLCSPGRGIARRPQGPNTLAPRALCTGAPARPRPGLKLEGRCSWGVSRYGDLPHAVQELSSAGLERRHAPAPPPTLLAP